MQLTLTMWKHGKWWCQPIAASQFSTHAHIPPSLFPCRFFLYWRHLTTSTMFRHSAHPLLWKCAHAPTRAHAHRRYGGIDAMLLCKNSTPSPSSPLLPPPSTESHAHALVYIYLPLNTQPSRESMLTLALVPTYDDDVGRANIPQPRGGRQEPV